MFYLLSAERSQDAIGQWVEERIERPVFGQVNSVTASEFFSGGQNGFKPELRFTMFGPDYQGEEVIRYEGNLYTIYRTYRARTDIIELYTEKRVGQHDTPPEPTPPEPEVVLA